MPDDGDRAVMGQGTSGSIARISGQVAAIAVLATACASGTIRDGAYVNEAKGFAVELPSVGWTADTHGEPDLLLRHADRDAGISIHATCRGIPPERPPEIVSRHLFFGIRGKRVLRQEGRAALAPESLDVILRGELDGRELLLHGYSLLSPRCIYDLVLFAAPEAFATTNVEFEALVRSFRRSEGGLR